MKCRSNLLVDELVVGSREHRDKRVVKNSTDARRITLALRVPHCMMRSARQYSFITKNTHWTECDAKLSGWQAQSLVAASAKVIGPRTKDRPLEKV